MKILHIMSGKQIFTASVVDLYDNEFDHSEHEICYLRKNNESTNIRNTIDIPQHEIIFKHEKQIKNIIPSIKLIRLMNQYDFIVLHSFCVNIIVSIFLYLNNQFCKKRIVWIEWGYDLYDFKPPQKLNLKKIIKYEIGKKIRNSVNSFIGIFPPDCDYYREKYPDSEAKIFYAPYIGFEFKNNINTKYTFNSRLKRTKDNMETIYIQIGHNAQKQLNHIKALIELEKYANEDIMLFLPLSYSGNEQYVCEIEEYLEKHFHKKYIVLKDFMPKDDYYRLIERIDIAVFYTYRQTGLANIHQMIRKNVKLFMPDNSIMYQYFKVKGIPIAKIEDIEGMNFEEFSSPIEWKTFKGPENYIKELDNYSKHLDLWKKIYNHLRNSIN